VGIFKQLLPPPSERRRPWPGCGRLVWLFVLTCLGCALQSSDQTTSLSTSLSASLSASLPEARLAGAGAPPPRAVALGGHPPSAGPCKAIPYSAAPLSFERNQGQAAAPVEFLARGRGYGLFLQADTAVLALRNPAQPRPSRIPKETLETAAASGAPAEPVFPPTVLKMHVVNANPAAQGRVEQSLTSYSNYFLGNDPARWTVQVPHYARVAYADVYPGIDLVYYGQQGALEYDFIVHPGADPAGIRVAFEGVERSYIDQTGALVLQTAAGEVRQRQPVVYQEDQGERRPVAGRYTALGPNEFGFAVAAYDERKPLVIDPVLSYSTYLGGFDNEYGNGIEADAAGNAYVTGLTYSADFPTKAPLQFSLGGIANAFIAKYDASGRLVYSTFLGGAGEDSGFVAGCDASGNVYVGGTTDSNNFPLTSNAYQNSRRGRLDGFLSKLSANGSTLLYSTFLGGTSDDTVNSLALDAANNIYLTGQTLSVNFPTRSPWQNGLKGTSDAFLAKFNTDGTLAYSTYLGGSGREVGYGVTVDGANQALITGIVWSSDFPTRNPFQAQLGGAVDAFVTKFNATGSGLVYSTYAGGALDDGGYGIGVDAAGNAYVGGFSTSTNFPTQNAFQPTNRGGDDAVVFKLDPAGALVYATYLGGAGEERGFDLAADSEGNAYLTGRTESVNFPVQDALQPRIGTGTATASSRLAESADLVAPRSIVELYGRAAWPFTAETAEPGLRNQTQPPSAVRDAFIAKYAPDGKVLYATFLGGGEVETAYAIAVDNRGNAYVTGLTASGNFPVKNPAQGLLRGTADAFIAKVADLGDTQKTVSAASYVGETLAPEQIVSSFGSGLATSTRAATGLPLPTNLLNCEVRVEDARGAARLAPLFFVSPTQINFTVPKDTAEGGARVTVWNNGAIVSAETIHVARVAPGLFTANATGKDVLAGVLLRVKSNGQQLYEPVARFDPILNRFVPVPIEFGNDQLYLLAFGTGLRYRGGLPTVSAQIGGLSSEVLYAGAQGSLVGLDQINLVLSPGLAGRGEVNLTMFVDGKSANPITLNFK
jgi:uncharacterized protein (TIGR03437 family)